MIRRNARLALFVFTSLLVLTEVALLVRSVATLHRLGILGITYQDHLESKAAERMRDEVPILAGLLRSGQILLLMEDGPAARAGLRMGDQMLSLDGIPISDKERLQALADRVGPGDPIVVRWQPGDSDIPSEAVIRLESPLQNLYLIFSPGSSVLVGLVYFGIGALVLRARKAERSALVFHLLTTMGAGFFMTWALYELQIQSPRGILPNSVGMDSGAAYVLALYAFFAFGMTAALAHFSLVFPRVHRYVERYPRIVAALYATPAMLAVSFFGGIALLTVSGPVWVAVLAGSLALGSVAIFMHVFRRGGAVGIPALLHRPIITLTAVTFAVLALLQLLRLGHKLAYPVGVGLTWGLGTLGISFGFPILALVFFVGSYRASGFEEKRQFRWPLFGLITAMGGILLLGIAGMTIGLSAGFTSAGAEAMAMNVTLQALSKLTYLLIPVSFAFGILKYRLLDIDIVIRKTLVYSIVSAVVLVLYLLMVGGIGTLIVRSTGSRSDVVVIGATLLVALVFIPMRNKVQALVDRTFFRNRASLPLVLRELGAQLNATDDVATILSITAERIQRGLQLRHVRIVSGKVATIATTDGTDARTGGADFAGVFDDRGFNVARTPTAPSELTLTDAMREMVAMHGIERVVAPAADRGVVAVVLAGPKLSDREWESEDDEFLISIAERMALSVETARLRHEEEEFRQAQQIQRSLLPRELPQIEGLTVSGFWQPARAVGGDYYDCLRFDDHRMAVCIGDVVGKGMPAALLMSSLQAGVRAVADTDTSPATVLERVRRVVENTLDRGKFITFFYGILDRAAGEFRYSNAGHNPPILVRRDGSVVWLEDGGPAFARLFSAQPFVVGTIAIAPGDRIVMFTDGLTEAENSAGDPLGDERLLELVVSSRELPARELQEALLTAVLRYSDGNLHDDLTLLVIEVS